MVNPHDIAWWVRREPVRYLNVDEFPLLPDNFNIDPSEPELIQWCRERTEYGEENLYTKDWDADQWRTYLNTYYRLVERADHEIGRMLRTARYKYAAYRGGNHRKCYSIWKPTSVKRKTWSMIIPADKRWHITGVCYVRGQKKRMTIFNLGRLEYKYTSTGHYRSQEPKRIKGQRY